MGVKNIIRYLNFYFNRAHGDSYPDYDRLLSKKIIGLNSKVSELVYALNERGLTTHLSGDFYGLGVIYVDLDISVAKVILDQLPEGWDVIHTMSIQAWYLTGIDPLKIIETQEEVTRRLTLVSYPGNIRNDQKKMESILQELVPVYMEDIKRGPYRLIKCIENIDAEEANKIADLIVDLMKNRCESCLYQDGRNYPATTCSYCGMEFEDFDFFKRLLPGQQPVLEKGNW